MFGNVFHGIQVRRIHCIGLGYACAVYSNIQHFFACQIYIPTGGGGGGYPPSLEMKWVGVCLRHSKPDHVAIRLMPKKHPVPIVILTPNLIDWFAV